MNTPLSSQEIDKLARRRAGAQLGWYTHVAVFVLVNLVLLGLSTNGFGTRPWSMFPLLGWGLGLALHGLSVFLIGAGGGLREHLVQKERERLHRQQGRP